MRNVSSTDAQMLAKLLAHVRIDRVIHESGAGHKTRSLPTPFTTPQGSATKHCNYATRHSELKFKTRYCIARSVALIMIQVRKQSCQHRCAHAGASTPIS